MKFAIFKCLSIVLFLACIATLVTGCGNMSVTGIGTFTFRHVHVSTHQQAECYTVNKWVDSSTGIEVITAESGAMFLSEGTYILFENKSNCPFCNKEVSAS